MRISIVGTGYVGLVSGACFAEMGAEVACVDTDEAKIERLSRGEIPFYEPGLDELVLRNQAAGRLRFCSRLADALPGSEALFVAVGTPQKEDGSADLSYVFAVAEETAALLENDIVFVIKSTVPVGTSERVRESLEEALRRRGSGAKIHMASNPEFLKEGSAVKDFMSPDRVIVGIDSDRAREVLTRLYKPFLLNNFRVMFMDIASAEMTKYASNAMLATRISFMNDIANLCELVGADVNKVRSGMGSDARIGSKFLYAGCGYGGSCFPKDVRALVSEAARRGYEMKVLKAVDQVNEYQKRRIYAKLLEAFPTGLAGRRIAVWGLAFKPNTDDIREAPALALIDDLLAAGCEVSAFDPIVKTLPGRPEVELAGDIYSAAEGADAVCLITEWKEFRLPDWPHVRRIMRSDVVVDGRNIYDAGELGVAGFRYINIGARVLPSGLS